MEDLNNVLVDKLEQYNNEKENMDLVLFDMAMRHITRIARIIEQPKGHALLVGVGGSGKQSLSKLASYILAYDVFRIVVSSSYSANDLKTDQQTLFRKAGVVGQPTLFILTDTQIVNERFLVSINDILSSGYVPELFPDEDKDEIIGKVRAEAKGQGIPDINEEIWNFFLEKTTKNLHMALCFSPVSQMFRIRARMFPAIINCTSIDWFHDWPEDALIGVANRFLGEVEFPREDLRDLISRHMAKVHLSIEAANQDYKKQERRFNYTTPTSFLELIKFYKLFLKMKKGAISDNIDRLEKGLNIMHETTEAVALIKAKVEQTQKLVNIEKEKTQELIDVVEDETAKANIEEEAASEVAAKTKIIKDAADAKKADVDEKLAAAVPALMKAKDAVAGLNVKSIGEMKNFSTPPNGVPDVGKAVLLLRGEYNAKKHEWPMIQNMMKDPNKFKDSLENYDKDNVPDKALELLKPIQAKEYFNETDMMKKSQAAANICKWVLAVIEYNNIFRNVKPLKDAADEAQAIADEKGAELKEVMDKLEVVRKKVRDLNEKLDGAKAKLKEVEDEANKLNARLGLAERLVNGLADEQIRWTENVKVLKDDEVKMIGNALLSAAFVSYIGPFLYTFRNRLWRDEWIPDIAEKKIPYTEGVDPLFVLSTKSMQAVWAQQELPSDRVSLENAAIVTNCKRYPLIIDPQLQGIRWLKGKEGSGMQRIQLSEKNWDKKVQQCVE